ncbi:hypothetical protein [uncultured Metabacillus sp.]|uniref:hypothetical protein n=1 Tax=uncultured Metabacillus sp. TaxID=2860135 RepID=UPI0026229703|nr:hypothetical protein [uncultured Metabacillus sp.]
MSTETLPAWFWLIYYSFLFITFGTVIYSLIRKSNFRMSITLIVFLMTVPVISLLGCIGRGEGQNEFEYIFAQFLQGAVWSIYVVIGYLFLVIWWFVFSLSNKKIRNVKG